MTSWKAKLKLQKLLEDYIDSEKNKSYFDQIEALLYRQLRAGTPFQNEVLYDIVDAAASHGDFNLMRLVLRPEFQYDVSIRKRKSETPLSKCMGESRRFIKFMILNGFSLLEFGDRTPLRHAVADGSPSRVALLIAAGASRCNKPTFFVALDNGNVMIISLLIAIGAEIPTELSESKALLIASALDKINVARKRIERMKIGLISDRSVEILTAIQGMKMALPCLITILEYAMPFIAHFPFHMKWNICLVVRHFHQRSLSE